MYSAQLPSPHRHSSSTPISSPPGIALTLRYRSLVQHWWRRGSGHRRYLRQTLQFSDLSSLTSEVGGFNVTALIDTAETEGNGDVEVQSAAFVMDER